MSSNIYHVAERAGVSASTVSRALRGDRRIPEATRQRVERAASHLNYVPRMAAQVLAGQGYRTLGMVLPHIEGTYYAELAVGFEMRASELDLSVVVLQANHHAAMSGAVRRLVGQCDGLAFLAKSAASDELVAEVARTRPTLTVARTHMPGITSIYAESAGPSQQLTAHLLELGRRRLAFVGPVDPGSDIEARHRGFGRALTAAGLAVPEPITVPMDEPAGRALARQLVEEDLPYDALVCGNDEIAVALVHELQELGVAVPDDVAVVGWDDIRVSRYLRPGLTTVAQPLTELGGLAAEHLHQLLQGQPVPEKTVLDTVLVHRQSCGCITANHPPLQQRSNHSKGARTP
ncbi:LacI family DNA-binding transcriptional regulator [Propioniciclava soli]|uniref:LacI family DNA-binding transcriptional regulator n=1 Tax=Propioniciclava soli TaxID=2775081 RepID=A0ABZ3C815_9ACTN